MPKRFGLCCALLALSTSALAESRGPAARLNSLCGTTTGRWCTCWRWAPRGNSITGNLGPGWWRRERVPALCCFAAQSRTASSPARRSSSTAAAASFPTRSADRSSITTSASCLPGKRRWSSKVPVQGHFTEVLEFRLQNANKTARALAPENAPSPPLPTEERAALPAPAPRRHRGSRSLLRQRSLRTLPPRRKRLRRHRRCRQRQNAPAVVADVAPAPKAVAAPPPRPPAQTPPAVVADAVLAPKAAAAPPRPSTPAPDLTAEIERTRAARLQAAAAAEAAQAAELAAHRASAEAEAARAAAEAHVQQNRDELRAAREENSEERSRQYLILAAMAWTLLLSGVAIVLLFAKLRRSQSPPKTENPKTEDASAATMTRSSVYSRFSESIAQADAASAAKSHGYQSGGRVRVFFQTRASNPSGNSSALRRVGYAPR